MDTIQQQLHNNRISTYVMATISSKGNVICLNAEVSSLRNFSFITFRPVFFYFYDDTIAENYTFTYKRSFIKKLLTRPANKFFKLLNYNHIIDIESVQLSSGWAETENFFFFSFQ